MIESILDSSVLIALLRDESVDGNLLDVIEGAVMGAVNFAEVWTKLHDFGLSDDPRVSPVLALLSRIEPFTESQAKHAADLRTMTRRDGLSLGDRACLALALEMGADVYTADHAWSRIAVGCSIHLIR